MPLGRACRGNTATRFRAATASRSWQRELFGITYRPEIPIGLYLMNAARDFTARYEDNRRPLCAGDASAVFEKELKEIRLHSTVERAGELTPETVVRWAEKTNQPRFGKICRRMLLPGSEIQGMKNLVSLASLASDGQACLICLNHRSNLDVPTLYTLMTDQADPTLFDRIVWIAGRKLEEDVGMTNLLVQCFNRVIVTPHGWFDANRSDDEVHHARQLNIAAERAVARLRHQGWIFALFPAGTRIRTDDASTKQAIAEIHGYLRMFDYVVMCHIDGCTLPVSKDRDFAHETPRLDKVVYTFGTIHRTDVWLENAASRFPTCDHRRAAVLAMSEDMESLGA